MCLLHHRVSCAAGQYSSSTLLAAHVADLSRSDYERILQKEEEPEILVYIPKQSQTKTPLEPMLDATVRLDYAVSTSGRGASFEADYCFVHNEVESSF